MQTKNRFIPWKRSHAILGDGTELDRSELLLEVHRAKKRGHETDELEDLVSVSDAVDVFIDHMMKGKPLPRTISGRDLGYD